MSDEVENGDDYDPTDDDVPSHGIFGLANPGRTLVPFGIVLIASVFLLIGWWLHG